jgi:hypothetical protein
VALAIDGLQNGVPNDNDNNDSAEVNFLHQDLQI